jgi:hydroxyacylglutathione hydrolase
MKRYEIEALELGPMENFIYLITDTHTQRTAVVDPAWDVPAIIRAASKRGLIISDILLTHSHHDHINGVEELLSQFDAQLHLLKAEADFWPKAIGKPALHYGGDTIELGETKIDILHTPGHTPGSACYRIDLNLICGDTLFVFGCGRCDLQGGDPEAMYHTLKNLQRNLPDNIVIHPGHHYAEQCTSTMQEQNEGNPFLHFHSVDDFVRYRMHTHDKIRSTPYAPVKANEMT